MEPATHRQFPLTFVSSSALPTYHIVAKHKPVKQRSDAASFMRHGTTHGFYRQGAAGANQRRRGSCSGWCNLRVWTGDGVLEVVALGMEMETVILRVHAMGDEMRDKREAAKQLQGQQL